MNVALIGYGKMGKEIHKILLERGHTVTFIINASNSHDLNAENLSNAEVAIEFTGPSAALSSIKTCLLSNIPVVSGSTGWLADLPDMQKLTSELNGSFLHATNFSIGVNLFFEINRKTAALMQQHAAYRISIDETHHTEKKDAPSGTAISLAEQIIQENSLKTSWTNGPAKNESDISILSHRIDPAPGTHAVHYVSDVDEITIVHTAHNRSGFALGAVLAAEYIATRKGIFTMKEVLGI